MEKVHDEIIDRFEDEPKIMVTYTLDSFITKKLGMYIKNIKQSM